MKIRHATQSDFQAIADIHTESWKDVYSDVLPAEFLDYRINSDFREHWNRVEVQNEDVILVAEENLVIGFVAVWCRPIPFIDNFPLMNNHFSLPIFL